MASRERVVQSSEQEQSRANLPIHAWPPTEVSFRTKAPGRPTPMALQGWTNPTQILSQGSSWVIYLIPHSTP